MRLTREKIRGRENGVNIGGSSDETGGEDSSLASRGIRGRIKRKASESEREA